MFNDNFDENWDEHQWGQYIQEMERKTSGLKQFIDQTWGDPNDPNWVKFLREYESVEEALNAYLDEELSFDDAVYLDNGDEDEYDEYDDPDYMFEDDMFDDDDEDEDLDDFFDYLDEYMKYEGDPDEIDIPELTEEDLIQSMEILFGDDETEKELPEGFVDKSKDKDSEEDKDDFDLHDVDLPDFGMAETDEDTIDPDDYDPFFTRHFDIFEEACSINHYLMFKGQEFPNFKHHQQFNLLVDETLAMTAKLSSATTFEPDDPFYMGAIIAYCKRSLYHANRSLQMLFDGKKDLFDDKEYGPLHKQLFELRNNLSLFIYEMREYFEENK